MAQYHTTEQLQKIEHWLDSFAFPLERLQRLEEHCPIIPVYIGVDFFTDKPIQGVLTWHKKRNMHDGIQVDIFTESNTYCKTFACGRWTSITTIEALHNFFKYYQITYANGVLNA